MNAVFADAGSWSALFNPHDQLHDKAAGAAQVTQGRLIVTSQMVLTELRNHYASFGEPFRIFCCARRANHRVEVH